jgi:hypothetical protein
MNRAYLQWASGPLELTGGLWRLEKGPSVFYGPTDYFDPVPPLAWIREPAVGSEGGEGRCFLFDDLSAQAAVRWLADGTWEWTARLIDKNIAYTIASSFVSLRGRDGVGLEVSGTFPDFQARFEAVEWIYPGGATRFEWAAGFSTVSEGTQWTLESFQDPSGAVLGTLSSGVVQGTYLFASAEREFTAQWRFTPALVKAVEGGPFLFWPKVTWRFESSWLLEFQAQLPLGSDPGPLALNPGRAGLSMTYLF